MVILGARLSQLRARENLTQEEFCERIHEESGGLCEINALTLSAYENGRRNPKSPFLYWVGKTFNVTTDFLLGLDISAEPRVDKFDLNGTPILMEELYKFDQMPVYVKCKKLTFKETWALLNFEEQKVTVPHGTLGGVKIPITESMVFFAEKPINSPKDTSGLTPLTLVEVLKTDVVWVEMEDSVADYYKGAYYGYYKHNETHTCLIKLTGDRILSYDDYLTLYRAYRA